MRQPIIAGNWKMYKTIPEARQLVTAVLAQLAGANRVEVVFAPPFTALSAVKELLSGSPYKLAAQDLYWQEQGAFTGEISPLMLQDLGCDYVIIGHSERRQYFGETDTTVNSKVKAALAAGITPIICVGESLEQREAGATDSLITQQTKAALAGVAAAAIPELVIAYEPIWAIGTGKSCDTAEANRVIGLIRQVLTELYGAAAAQQTRLQYGGSVKPENVKDYLGQPEIDGALVGGASLEPDSFLKLVRFDQAES